MKMTKRIYLGMGGIAMRKAIFWILGFIVVVAAASSINAYMAKGASHSNEDVQSYVNEINRTLPHMLNQDTKAETVSLSGKRVTFKYELVNYRSSEISPQSILTSLESKTRNGVCSTASTRELLDAGYTLVYAYYSSDGFYLTEITVQKSDCR